MGQSPIQFRKTVDAADVTVVGGFLCIVVGVDLRYDHPLALIIFGVGLLLIGAVSLWRNA